MKAPGFAVVATALLLAACEGTWATPNQIDLKPMNGSKISGIVGISIPVARLHSNLPVGTNIDVQFEGLRDPKPYIVILQRGSCTDTRPQHVAADFKLYPYPDPSDGLEGNTYVDIPIHDIMKDGYHVSLVDRRSTRAVSCGDLHTARLW